MGVVTGGGGGTAFNGGTITRNLTINPATSPVDGLTYNAHGSASQVRIGDAEGATAYVAGAGQEALTVATTSAPADYQQIFDFTALGGAGNTLLEGWSDGQLDLTLVQADTNGLRVIGPSSTLLLRAAIIGFLFRYHAAPADSDLNAGDCALWFDQTNGAAKLMVKAKTANGTVVTGSLALA